MGCMPSKQRGPAQPWEATDAQGPPPGVIKRTGQFVRQTSGQAVKAVRRRSSGALESLRKAFGHDSNNSNGNGGSGATNIYEPQYTADKPAPLVAVPISTLADMDLEDDDDDDENDEAGLAKAKHSADAAAIDAAADADAAAGGSSFGGGFGVSRINFFDDASATGTSTGAGNNNDGPVDFFAANSAATANNPFVDQHTAKKLKAEDASASPTATSPFSRAKGKDGKGKGKDKGKDKDKDKGKLPVPVDLDLNSEDEDGDDIPTHVRLKDLGFSSFGKGGAADDAGSTGGTKTAVAKVDFGLSADANANASASANGSGHASPAPARPSSSPRAGGSSGGAVPRPVVRLAELAAGKRSSRTDDRDSSDSEAELTPSRSGPRSGGGGSSATNPATSSPLVAFQTASDSAANSRNSPAVLAPPTAPRPPASPRPGESSLSAGSRGPPTAPRLPPAVVGQSGPLAPLDETGFRILDQRTTAPEELPEYARGKALNRFYDVLPNPATRVILSTINSDPTSDYINANHIRGYHNHPPGGYIASQAPTAAWLDRFARMIWEQDIRTIVMATGFVEMGKTKCQAYYPSRIYEGPQDVLQMGDISSALLAVEKHEGWVLNKLRFTRGSESREVQHFWYNTWPDHGVPEMADGKMYVSDVLDMLLTVRKSREAQKLDHTPLLVHCSAGIGRTGTFILIDCAITAFRNGDQVDLLKMLEELRQDRMALVQHAIQFKFAHHACEVYLRTHPSLGDKNSAAGLPPRAGSVSVTADVPAPFGVPRSNTEPSISVSRPLGAAAAAGATTAAASASEPSGEASGSSSAVGLENQPWYRPLYSREEMELRLTASPAGSFLVRRSSQQGHYALTTNTGERLMNMLVVPVPGDDGATNYKLGRQSARIFKSVVDLVEYYKTHPFATDTSGKHLYLESAPPATAEPSASAAAAGSEV